MDVPNVYHSLTDCRGQRRLLAISDRLGGARAIKEARGLRVVSIMYYAPLRGVPPGVAEKVVGSVIIYIHIYATSTPSIF